MDDQNNLNNQNPVNPLDQTQSDQNVQPVGENPSIPTPPVQNEPVQTENTKDEIPSFAQIGDSSTPPPPMPTVEEIPDETEDTGSAAPNADIPPIISSDEKPKKKFGGKTIATILGILILVGGVGTGVILVKQQQDIREKAMVEEGTSIGVTGTPIAVGVAGIGTPKPTAVGVAGVGEATKTPYCSALNYKDCYYGCTPDVNGGTCKPKPATPATTCPADKKLVNGVCKGCEDVGGKCYGETTDTLPEGGCTPLADYHFTCSSGRVCLKCVGTSGSTGSTGSTSTTTTTTTPTNPPSTASVSCLNVKAYDTSWNPLTASNLSILKTGDKVRFTVTGTATSGTFDKAKFTINSVAQPETTSKKPSSGEFYTEYTIPSGITSFTISAQIHHTTKGWI